VTAPTWSACILRATNRTLLDGLLGLVIARWRLSITALERRVGARLGWASHRLMDHAAAVRRMLLSTVLADPIPEASAEADDPDQDGMSNRAEMLAGTDPADRTSLLILEWVPRPNDLDEEDALPSRNGRMRCMFGACREELRVKARTIRAAPGAPNAVVTAITHAKARGLRQTLDAGLLPGSSWPSEARPCAPELGPAPGAEGNPFFLGIRAATRKLPPLPSGLLHTSSEKRAPL